MVLFWTGLGAANINGLRVRLILSEIGYALGYARVSTAEMDQQMIAAHRHLRAMLAGGGGR